MENRKSKVLTKAVGVLDLEKVRAHGFISSGTVIGEKDSRFFKVDSLARQCIEVTEGPINGHAVFLISPREKGEVICKEQVRNPRTTGSSFNGGPVL